MNHPILKGTVRHGAATAALGALLLVACSSGDQPTSNQLVTRSASAAISSQQINGPDLEATIDGPSYGTTCANGLRDVNFDIGAISSASGADVSVYRSYCAGDACSSSTDPAQMTLVMTYKTWTKSELGPSYKQFGPDTDTIALAPGTYRVTYCVVQASEKDRFYDCTPPQPVDVAACPTTLPSGCGRRETDVFFGNLTSNKMLCNAKGVVPLHFVGDADDAVYVEITTPRGPNPAWKLEITLNRAGDSCNYQGQWKPGADNGGPADYLFYAYRDADHKLPLGTGFVATGLGCQ